MGLLAVRFFVLLPGTLWTSKANESSSAARTLPEEASSCWTTPSVSSFCSLPLLDSLAEPSLDFDLYGLMPCEDAPPVPSSRSAASRTPPLPLPTVPKVSYKAGCRAPAELGEAFAPGEVRAFFARL